MSVRSFRSVFMVASCAGAALGCYLVSLRVASERAALEDVETQIVLAQRDLRVLQTEIGTRGRLAQLERWNVKVLALSAPTADQFLTGSFELAKLARPEEQNQIEAPVVLASAPAPVKPQIPEASEEHAPSRSASPAALMHEASLKQPARAQISAAAKPAQAPVSTTAKLKSEMPANSAKSAKLGTKPSAEPAPKVAAKTAVQKPAKAAAKSSPKVDPKPAAKTKSAAENLLITKPSKSSPVKTAALNKPSAPTKAAKDSARKQ